jgi:hypothetical protein
VDLLTYVVHVCIWWFRRIFIDFIGGGIHRIRRKPLTCHKSQTNFITYCCIKYTSTQLGFKLTTLVVIGTDFIGSCKPWHLSWSFKLPLFYWWVFWLTLYVSDDSGGYLLTNEKCYPNQYISKKVEIWSFKIGVKVYNYLW